MLLAFVAVGLARPIAAQSLGDLARQEEERRKAVKTPAKVITNKDLGAVPPSAPVPPARPAAPASPSSAKPAEAPKEADKDAKDPNAPVKDQAYWANRAKGLQAQLDRDQSYLDAMQSRINALTTDFANRSDPAQRAVVERDRQKALADLAQLKTAIVADKKALTDLDEEARRAGVPPGWLR